MKMFEQAANLAVFSLVENDFQPRIAFATPKIAGLFHAKKAAVARSDAFAQTQEQGQFRKPVNLYMIRFVEMRLRRGDAGGPFRVIGEQQQSFARITAPETH